MDSEQARKRIADAAAELAEKEKREQDSGDYPAADRAEQIRDTAGD